MYWTRGLMCTVIRIHVPRPLRVNWCPQTESEMYSQALAKFLRITCLYCCTDRTLMQNNAGNKRRWDVLETEWYASRNLIIWPWSSLKCLYDHGRQGDYRQHSRKPGTGTSANGIRYGFWRHADQSSRNGESHESFILLIYSIRSVGGCWRIKRVSNPQFTMHHPSKLPVSIICVVDYAYSMFRFSFQKLKRCTHLNLQLSLSSIHWRTLPPQNHL